MLTFHPNSYNLPIPRRFRTTFVCEADFQIPMATAAVSSGVVCINDLRLPFYYGGSAGFPSYTFLGPGSGVNSLRPTGFSTICTANLYSYYKILRSRLMVRWNGATIGDSVSCVVLPIVDIISPTDIYTARTFPYAKQCTFSTAKGNTNTNRDGWLVCSINPRNLSGFTPTEWAADWADFTGTAVTPPSIQFVWKVFLATNDAGVTAGDNSIQFRLISDVELFSIQKMPLTLEGSSVTDTPPDFVEVKTTDSHTSQVPQQAMPVAPVSKSYTSVGSHARRLLSLRLPLKDS